MARFRVETVFDSKSGCYYMELYYPDDAATPQATTGPIYSSHEEAERDALRMFKSAFPGQPVSEI